MDRKSVGAHGAEWGMACLAAGFVAEAWTLLMERRTWALVCVGWMGKVARALGMWLIIGDFRRRDRWAGETIRQLEERLREQEETHARQLREAGETGHREMEAFRSALSHSLRMPIAIIQGYADLLAGNVTTDPEVRKNYLEKIVQRTQDMTDVLGRTVLHGELSGNNLSYSTVDLILLTRQTAEDMRTAAEERSVRIQVLSSEDRLIVQADEYLISRVLFNLLENALKYMGRPGTVSIRVQRQEKEATVSIQDDGFGLPEEEVEHIFRINFQGSNRVGGQGYGLYMVKQIVEAHGGAITARSKVGKGMGIRFTLPLERPESQGAQEKAAAAQGC